MPLETGFDISQLRAEKQVSHLVHGNKSLPSLLFIMLLTIFM